MSLKYLFIAEYEDGTTYKQSPKDISKLEPDKRSEFYDVLNSGKRVVRFTLKERALFAPKWISVDLQTGQFSHSPNVHDEELLVEGDWGAPPTRKRELIFFRQHQHDFNRGTQEELAHRVTYCLGWQTNVRGRNYKQIWGLA